MSKSCSFCNEIAGKEYNNLFKSIIEPHYFISSRIIHESEHWVVMPTIGCFSPGYILFVTKKHFLSLGHAPVDVHDDLKRLVDGFERLLQNLFNKKTVLFEHGALDAVRKGGCCIDHAHLHMLPHDSDFTTYFRDKTYLVRSIDSTLELRDQIGNKRSYLYLKNNKDDLYIVENEYIPSQICRKIITANMKIPEVWDWRQHYFIDNIKITYEKLIEGLKDGDL